MIMMIMMIYHDHHHHHDEGGPSQRPGGKQEDDPPPISGKKPNPLSVDPSAVDMRGNLFSPLPNSIRGARDDRCWWEAFQGVGEGVNTVTRASKEGKAVINSCVCVLLLLGQLHSTVECERHKGTKRGVKPVRLAFAACLRLLF